MKTLFMLCLAACTLACNNHDSVHEAKLENRMTEGIMPVNKADADFMVEATNGNLTEVEAGKLVFGRTSDSQVKKFASMMIDDHSRLLAQLNNIAGNKQIAVPDSVSNSNRSKIDELAKKSGRDLNKAYMKWMVDDHDQDVTTFRRMSVEAQDTAIRTFATNALPVLLSHQQMAHAIYDGMK